MRSFRIVLPMPPSVNKIWLTRKSGVTKSPAYSSWLAEAGWRVNEERAAQRLKNLPSEHWYWTDIRLPQSHLGDSDNRLKAVHDLLHQMGATPDDKWLLGGTYIRCNQVDPGTCEVNASAVESAKMSDTEQIRHLATRMLAALA